MTHTAFLLHSLNRSFQTTTFYQIAFLAIFPVLFKLPVRDRQDIPGIAGSYTDG